MPRKDFDILVFNVDEEWGTGKDIMFLNYNQMGNHSFLDYMTRIVYMKEEIPVNVFRKIHGKGRKDIENHMPMDIYVLDNASDNEKYHTFDTEDCQWTIWARNGTSCIYNLNRNIQIVMTKHRGW